MTSPGVPPYQDETRTAWCAKGTRTFVSLKPSPARASCLAWYSLSCRRGNHDRGLPTGSSTHPNSPALGTVVCPSLHSTRSSVGARRFMVRRSERRQCMSPSRLLLLCYPSYCTHQRHACACVGVGVGVLGVQAFDHQIPRNLEANDRTVLHPASRASNATMVLPQPPLVYLSGRQVCIVLMGLCRIKFRSYFAVMTGMILSGTAQAAVYHDICRR